VDAETILWRRLDRPGHEAGRIFAQDSSWIIEGTAIFTHERHPCRLDYWITCNFDWETIAAKVSGWVNQEKISIELSVGANRVWTLNGLEAPQVTGCLDLDLNFSPSTNLLPIRRLSLEEGQAAHVKAAWLRFPEFTLEPLDQVYTRLGPTTYRYESSGGSFSTELITNSFGQVIHYPNLWVAED
jgi:hypothetical protein